MRAWLAVAAAALAGCAPAPETVPGEPVTEPPPVLSLQVPALQVPALAAALPAPAIETPIAMAPLVDCRRPAADYDHLFRLAATRSNFWGDREDTARWLAAIGCVESRYDNAAASAVGGRCVFQFMPGTARDYRVNLDDPESCIEAGGRYYAWQYRQWCPRHDRTPRQCQENASAAGNWGLGNLIDLQPVEGCLNWPCFAEHAPAETVHHNARIAALLGGGSW